MIHTVLRIFTISAIFEDFANRGKVAVQKLIQRVGNKRRNKFLG